MKRGIALIPLLVSLMLLLVICTAFAESTTNETWIHFPLDYAGLKIEIKTPCRADPGDNITVTVRAAAPLADLEIHYLYVDIFGLKNETDEVLLMNITHLDSSRIKHRQVYEVDYIVTIPNDTSPGLTYGVVSCLWEFEGAPHKIPAAGFIVTYVSNKELDQLHREYEELNATYHSLHSNYTEIDSQYAAELGGARNMMYVFVGTTIVAVATIILLVLRRPSTYY